MPRSPISLWASSVSCICSSILDAQSAGRAGKCAITGFLVLLVAVPAVAQHRGGATPGSAATEDRASPPAHPWISTDAYPLDTCIVSGRALGEEVIRVEAAGRTFKFCSVGCLEKLAKDPESCARKLDQAAIALQLPDYPLERCPISGKELGATVKPVDVVLDGHLVRLCSEACTKAAVARKVQIVADIEAAATAKQRGGYPLTACLSTGEPLQPETTIEVVHGTTLLRLGGQECLQDLDRRPAAFIRELRAARAKVPLKDAKPASPRAPAVGFQCAHPSDKKPVSLHPESASPTRNKP